MYPLVRQSHVIPRTLAFYSRQIDLCLSSKSVKPTKIVHAQLIKVGLNSHTFLGNRCLELYTRYSCLDNILKAFGDITRKNIISWNICLKGVLKNGHDELAHSLFEEMPERDVVSWNSIFSWYTSCDHSDIAWVRFRQMLHTGVKPSAYTFSILISMVSYSLHGKELHGGMIKSGLIRSNVVLGNSLIDMYSKLGIINYAYGVFLTMDNLDMISWNSMIIGYSKCGCGELALSQFSLMRSSGYPSDEFTCSAVITCCTTLRNLEKGKQIFALCIKVGFLCNSIISSAIIDLFSKCNRLELSVQLFNDLNRWDSVVCNSMISSYTSHGIGENALKLLVRMLRANIRPTEFTLCSVLSSISGIPVEQGTQIHSMVIKSGFEKDYIVGSSIVDMYSKVGLIDCAIIFFASMSLRDIISWNTMIMGLVHNGRSAEALKTFMNLCKSGLPPDRISFAGVLLACSCGGFIDEGTAIFSKMECSYGVKPCYEHYATLVDMLCQAGRFNEALEVTKRIPQLRESTIWGTLLHACLGHGDVRLAEKVAERLLELEPQLSLPYIVLAHIYEMRGQWEDIVRVRETMKRNIATKVGGRSWIVLKGQLYTFMAEQLHHHASKEIYSVLELLALDKNEITATEFSETDVD
ncbi:pentatricopeptide repeat-containing protein At1g43980, mitochondrial [Silene latifolia]|uniref:pentatricopeptide repeat-containing protein At1g43980, mitochondrial n=1 Tax=Silene latifolia TaxID=37657 RepID=UPI003D785C41